MRVEIPVYTDRWMMGDRFGTVTNVYNGRKRNAHGELPVMAHVKLDISGKTTRVLFEDCKIVEESR